MPDARDIAQAAKGLRLPATVNTGDDYLAYGASNFTGQMGRKDWRVYQTSTHAGTGGDAWLLRLTGPEAEEKAKAIALILNGHS